MCFFINASGCTAGAFSKKNSIITSLNEALFWR